ncbi:MAG: endonuclease III [Deltaproteobacteria bacterium RIFCSPLOWO2_12_FULL_43_16]|nr:MAG: endonuclease III [Deltaproteobacteria bacterium GWA2_43_19]OGQ12779.1 MAG: endonuclease III [Deltaproteobacteria bacterium RIFCSPHIGHO2_02_FULL_43_33]OGQ37467.1 MAG: endonuclease III [Deltaproteobacteria bacterium RIFCSPLOWO2_01_FULL_42_9]OGQ57104.1 MAG: endonuclease III [Deltaproteobacteria bacterium RIFCSPLOWO2_12_FULL_43_16]HBR18148.1 endonuclease III [Deltaproteobacteria bacterium]
MHARDIPKVIKILKQVNASFTIPAVTQISNKSRSPFMVLISCILSLRTKDSTTAGASKRLFDLATTPKTMMNLPLRTIEKAIYPVGFYRNKAKVIKNICKQLVEEYHSKTPDIIDELLKFKGVGRKTANLVVTIGYGKPGICVDTHVHRITNRWGYVKTKTPEETEFALRKKLLKRYWIIINDLLVTFGQNICKPISPLCSKCRLYQYCDRVGVVKSR